MIDSFKITLSMDDYVKLRDFLSIIFANKYEITIVTRFKNDISLELKEIGSKIKKFSIKIFLINKNDREYLIYEHDNDNLLIKAGIVEPNYSELYH